MSTVQVYLTRRNLLTLLSKLDRAKAGDTSACTIIKHDTEHPTHPQSHSDITITAVEDGVYYVDRAAGGVHPLDEQRIA